MKKFLKLALLLMPLVPVGMASSDSGSDCYMSDEGSEDSGSKMLQTATQAMTSASIAPNEDNGPLGVADKDSLGVGGDVKQKAIFGDDDGVVTDASNIITSVGDIVDAVKDDTDSIVSGMNPTTDKKDDDQPKWEDVTQENARKISKNKLPGAKFDKTYLKVMFDNSEWELKHYIFVVKELGMNHYIAGLESDKKVKLINQCSNELLKEFEGVAIAEFMDGMTIESIDMIQKDSGMILYKRLEADNYLNSLDFIVEMKLREKFS